jgi:diguanylate cyclase (GGDEF)-like protein
MVGWLALLGAAAAALAMRVVQSWRRPLDAAVAQAQALQERRFVLADEPRVPELRRLTRSMNSMVLRLQELFAGQAAQLEDLRKLALADAVTGLPNRRQFLTLLSSALGAERQRGAGLLLIRLRDLTAMNQRIGHEGTDRLLAALADVLQAYPQRAEGVLVGRLNGSDFALYLPAPKLVRDSAFSLIDALRAALATVDQGAELVIGGVDGQLSHDAGDALSQADAALARAEESGAFAVEVADGDSEQGVGEGEWRTRLVDALAAGRMRLAESAVRDAQGALVHLQCQTQLRWAGAADFQPAARWLAMAVRCRLAAQVDLGALALALSAIAGDGRPRCIAFSAASLETPGFVASVVQRLQAAPRQAALLSIGFRESAVRRNASRIAEAFAAWRPLSVRSGLEQAGAALRELTPQLAALGIDYIRIDAAFVHDVARHGAVRDYARGLVVLVHGMGVRVLADGVADKEDLTEVWTLQFDGAGGAAVSAGRG